MLLQSSVPIWHRTKKPLSRCYSGEQSVSNHCMDTVRSLPAVRCVVATSVLLLLASTAAARGQMLGDAPAQTAPRSQSAPAPLPPPSYGPVPLAPSALNFDAVMASGYSQSSFTFDRSMLQAADGFFGGSDPETRRVVAGLNSISVHNYHARDFARYDPGALAMIDGQLRVAGWKHLVNASAKGNGNTTDMWLHFDGPNITNVTVLSRGDRNMSVMAVDCSLRPLDLLHLSGHFGIPKVDEGAVMVPAH